MDYILISKEEVRQIIAARLSDYIGLSKFDFLVTLIYFVKEKFLIKFVKEYLACKNNGIHAPASDDCFVRRFWLIYQYQNFPRIDPNLPAALLPQGWIGFKSRLLFDDYHSILEKPANQFVDEVLGRDKN